MFERFSLPDVAAVSRRTVLGAIVTGVVGIVLCLLFNQPWAAVGLGLGLGLGIFNFRLIQRSVVKVGERMDQRHRRPLALNTLSRMMLITVVALGLLFVEAPLGFGLLGGLALFQLLLLLNVTRSMLKMGAGGGGGGLVGAIDASAEEVPASGADEPSNQGRLFPLPVPDDSRSED